MGRSFKKHLAISFRLLGMCYLLGIAGYSFGTPNPDYQTITNVSFQISEKATLDNIDDGDWKGTTLPFMRWIDKHQGYIWFRLSSYHANADGRTAIYIPHHAFDINIYRGKQLIASQTRADGKEISGWNNPYYVETTALNSSSSTLYVRLRIGEPTVHLSNIFIGPPALVKPKWEQRHLLQKKTAEWMLIATIILGAFTFILWYKRKQDSQYLIFSLLCFFWSIVLLYMALPFAPFDHGPWLRFVYWSVDVAGLFLFIFINKAMAFQHQKLERYFIAVTVVGGISLASFPNNWLHTLSNTTHFIALVFILIPLVKTLAFAVKTRSATSLYISTGTTIGFALLIIDLYRFYLAYSTSSLLPDSTVIQHCFFFMLLTLFALLIRRFVNTLTDFETLNLTLESRIQMVAKQLEQSFEETRILELKTGAEMERQRIMRDLHDDVGAKLVSILHTKENDQQTTLARDALSSMRGIVSESFDAESQLVTVLNTCHNEMESRLISAGITLREVGLSDIPLLDIDTAASHHIHRILREIITNIIKHSKASLVSVSYRYNEQFQCNIADNGIGFSKTELYGSGLKNISYRASQIQATVDWESDEKGSNFTLTLNTPI